MAKRIKDTDYLSLSARVRAMENDLLTAEQFEQLIAAKSDDEARKLLQSFGYGELEPAHPEAIDANLTAVRAEALEDLGAGLPDPGYLDIFKIKYDYHNVKALLKGDAMDVEAGAMLTDLGRVPVETLSGYAKNLGELDGMPGCLGDAAREGYEILSTTRDPQLSEIAEIGRAHV